MKTMRSVIEEHKGQISSTDMAPMILHLASLYSLNVRSIVQKPSENVFISEDSFRYEVMAYLIPLIERLGLNVDRPLSLQHTPQSTIAVIPKEDNSKLIAELENRITSLQMQLGSQQRENTMLMDLIHDRDVIHSKSFLEKIRDKISS